MAKFQPQNKSELAKLVSDESIYLGDIDTSKITDMSSLFEGSKRKDFSGIENWDTSNVTNMSYMFFCAYDFNHNINSWNVSSVTNMQFMFYDAYNFNQPLDKWDTSKLAHALFIFSGAESFNQDISSWDTSSFDKEDLYSGYGDIVFMIENRQMIPRATFSFPL